MDLVGLTISRIILAYIHMCYLLFLAPTEGSILQGAISHPTRNSLTLT